MKNNISQVLLVVLLFIGLSSMTIKTSSNDIIIPKKEFNSFFMKRTFLYSNVEDLEKNYKTKFNFSQKLAIKLLKHKIKKELKQQHLLDECDKIYFKNGDSTSAIVTEVGKTELKYKKCDNKNGPTYTIDKSNIISIVYANGSKDIFNNDATKKNNDEKIIDEITKYDPLAIASLGSEILGLLLITIPYANFFAIFGFFAIIAGIILGLISLSKKRKGKFKGKGLAIAGIVLGFGFLAITLLVFLILLFWILTLGGIH